MYLQQVSNLVKLIITETQWNLDLPEGNEPAQTLMDGSENARESFQICSILSSLIHFSFLRFTPTSSFTLLCLHLICPRIGLINPPRGALSHADLYECVILIKFDWLIKFFMCAWFCCCWGTSVISWPAVLKEDSYLPDTLYICSHKAARLQHLCIRVCVCVMISVPVGRPGCSRIYRRCSRYSNVYLKQHVPERPRIHLHSSSSSPSFSLTPYTVTSSSSSSIFVASVEAAPHTQCSQRLKVRLIYRC